MRHDFDMMAHLDLDTARLDSQIIPRLSHVILGLQGFSDLLQSIIGSTIEELGQEAH
jgi:hypothetical protein